MRLRKMLGLTQKGAPDTDDEDMDEDERERIRREAEDEAKRRPFSASVGGRNANLQARRRKRLMDEAGEY